MGVGGYGRNPLFVRARHVQRCVKKCPHFECVIHRFVLALNAWTNTLYTRVYILCPRFECRDRYVCMCVCVYVCPAMHFAMLQRIELKLGMGVGDWPTRFVGIFLKGPHLGSKVIQGSICLRKALWLPNLVKRTPDQSIVHCWGQRSCRGQLGSSRGQFA